LEDPHCERLFAPNRIIVRQTRLRPNFDEFILRLDEDVDSTELRLVLLTLQCGPKETRVITKELHRLAADTTVLVPDDFTTIEQVRKTIYFHVAAVGTARKLQQFLSELNEQQRFVWAQISAPTLDMPEFQTQNIPVLSSANTNENIGKMSKVFEGDAIQFLRVNRPEQYFALVPPATIAAFFSDPRIVGTRLRQRPVVFFELNDRKPSSLIGFLRDLQSPPKIGLLTSAGLRRYVVLRSEDFNEFRSIQERRATVRFETPTPQEQLDAVLAAAMTNSPPTNAKSTAAVASPKIAAKIAPATPAGSIPIIVPRIMPMVPMTDVAGVRISTIGWITKYNRPVVLVLSVPTAKKGRIADIAQIYEAITHARLPVKALRQLELFQNERNIVGSQLPRDPLHSLKVPTVSVFLADLLHSQRMAIVSNGVGDDQYVLIPGPGKKP
jgi:hypothetical protein